MNVLVWIVVISVCWFAVGLVVGLVLGATVRERDRGPSPIVPGPERMRSRR